MFAICSPGNGQGQEGSSCYEIESGLSGLSKTLRIFRLGETLVSIRFCVVCKDSEVHT